MNSLKKNAIATNKVGLGIHDLADACWRDYYEDGLHPLEALNCANEMRGAMNYRSCCNLPARAERMPSGLLRPRS
jgi:hypothetical protein